MSLGPIRVSGRTRDQDCGSASITTRSPCPWANGTTVPICQAVSPERDSNAMAFAASGSATTATMPTPQLKVRCISRQAMASWPWVQSKTGGRGQARVDDGADVGRHDPRQVLVEPAAGDVRERSDR